MTQREREFYRALADHCEALAEPQADDEAWVDAWLANEAPGLDAAPAGPRRRWVAATVVVLAAAAAIVLWSIDPLRLRQSDEPSAYDQAEQSQADGADTHAAPVHDTTATNRVPPRGSASERISEPAPTDTSPPEPTADTDPPEPAADTEGPVTRTATPPTSSGPAAAELLARARGKRAAGDARGAIAAYGALLRQYPRSTEATAARVPLGQLYLERGKARAALQHFRKYLRSNGPLAEEAHWGELSALHRLGRTDALRSALGRFEQRYPRSVYLGRARELVQ